MNLDTNTAFIDTCVKVFGLQLEKDFIVCEDLFWGKSETNAKRYKEIEQEIKLLTEKLKESTS